MIVSTIRRLFNCLGLWHALREVVRSGQEEDCDWRRDGAREATANVRGRLASDPSVDGSDSGEPRIPQTLFDHARAEEHN
jgi:hypothetical protein